MIAAPKPIPRPVVRRFPEYLVCLRRMRRAGHEWITSEELADVVGMTMSTVRQDISYLDFYGMGKRGYKVEGLRRVITHTLRLEEPATTVIGGGGQLARVLASSLNSGIQPPTFKICGIFDWNSNLIGTRIGKKVVRDAGDLPEIVRNNRVEIGIVATGAARAQAMVDLLASVGVRGVLNLSPVRVAVPKEVSFLDAPIALQKLVCEIRADATPVSACRET